MNPQGRGRGRGMFGRGYGCKWIYLAQVRSQNPHSSPLNPTHSYCVGNSASGEHMYMGHTSFGGGAYFQLHLRPCVSTQACCFVSDYPQFAPFGSFPPTLGYPLPGYPAAAAAANAAYTAQQQQPGKPPRNTERSRPSFTYTYPSVPSTWKSCLSLLFDNIFFVCTSRHNLTWAPSWLTLRSLF